MYSTSVQPQYIVRASSHYVGMYVDSSCCDCHVTDMVNAGKQDQVVRWTLFLCVCASLTGHAQTCPDVPGPA